MTIEFIPKNTSEVKPSKTWRITVMLLGFCTWINEGSAVPDVPNVDDDVTDGEKDKGHGGETEHKRHRPSRTFEKLREKTSIWKKCYYILFLANHWFLLKGITPFSRLNSHRTPARSPYKHACITRVRNSHGLTKQTNDED